MAGLSSRPQQLLFPGVSILIELKCSRCNIPPYPLIQLCKLGHVICQTCSSFCTTCPRRLPEGDTCDERIIPLAVQSSLHNTLLGLLKISFGSAYSTQDQQCKVNSVSNDGTTNYHPSEGYSNPTVLETLRHENPCNNTSTILESPPEVVSHHHKPGSLDLQGDSDEHLCSTPSSTGKEKFPRVEYDMAALFPRLGRSEQSTPSWEQITDEIEFPLGFQRHVASHGYVNPNFPVFVLKKPGSPDNEAELRSSQPQSKIETDLDNQPIDSARSQENECSNQKNETEERKLMDASTGVANEPTPTRSEQITFQESSPAERRDEIEQPLKEDLSLNNSLNLGNGVTSFDVLFKPKICELDSTVIVTSKQVQPPTEHLLDSPVPHSLPDSTGSLASAGKRSGTPTYMELEQKANDLHQKLKEAQSKLPAGKSTIVPPKMVRPKPPVISSEKEERIFEELNAIQLPTRQCENSLENEKLVIKPETKNLQEEASKQVNSIPDNPNNLNGKHNEHGLFTRERKKLRLNSLASKDQPKICHTDMVLDSKQEGEEIITGLANVTTNQRPCSIKVVRYQSGLFKKP